MNGILWERFTSDQQAAEIRQTQPSTSDQPTESSPIRPRPARPCLLVLFLPLLSCSSDLSQSYGDGLYLSVQFQRVVAHLASPPGLFVAAKW